MSADIARSARPGRVVPAETVREKVWDEYVDPFTNAARVTTVTLRRRLGEPHLIDTVEGVGYALRVEESSHAFRDALTEAGLNVPGVDERPPFGRPNDGVSRALDEVLSQARQNVLHDLLTRSSFAFLTVALVAMPLAYWLSGRIFRSIDEISRAANDLSAKTLSQRLANDGPDDEFGRLKTAFNGMLGRLESAFDSRQRFAAGTSHELRTPLAVLEAAGDNVLEARKPTKQAVQLAGEVKAQVERADSLIAFLPTLARADDFNHTRVDTDLASVPELFERFRRGAQRSEASGHGRGLPIVRRVAEMHGGIVMAIARSEGGLDVRVELRRRTTPATWKSSYGRCPTP